MLGILSGGLEKFYVEDLRNLVMCGNLNSLFASLFIFLRYSFRASLLFEKDMLDDLMKSDFLLSNLTHFKILPYSSNTFFYASLIFNLILIFYLLINYIFATSSYHNSKVLTNASTSSSSASSRKNTNPINPKVVKPASATKSSD